MTSLAVLEGFEVEPDYIDHRWGTGTTGLVRIDGERQGTALRYSGANVLTASRTFGTNYGPTLHAGVRFRVSELSTSTLLSITRGGTPHVRVELVPSSGRILLRVYRGVSAAWTSTVTLPEGSWHHVELGVTIADSTGAWILRVDQIELAREEGVDTRHSSDATADGLAFSLDIGLTGSFDLDDLYCIAGADLESGWWGDVDVAVLVPTGDVQAELMPLTGPSNFTNIDDGGDGYTTGAADWVYHDSSPATLDEDHYSVGLAGLHRVRGLQLGTIRSNDAPSSPNPTLAPLIRDDVWDAEQLAGYDAGEVGNSSSEEAFGGHVTPPSDFGDFEEQDMRALRIGVRAATA